MNSNILLRLLNMAHFMSFLFVRYAVKTSRTLTINFLLVRKLKFGLYYITNRFYVIRYVRGSCIVRMFQIDRGVGVGFRSRARCRVGFTGNCRCSWNGFWLLSPKLQLGYLCTINIWWFFISGLFGFGLNYRLPTAKLLIVHEGLVILEFYWRVVRFHRLLLV